MRLRAEAPTDTGALREKFGASVGEILALRAGIAERLKSGDKRSDELVHLDTALMELAQVFATLPRRPPASLQAPRAIQRRQTIRAMRLDESTRRLLRRAAAVIGITAMLGSALPAGAVAVGDFVLNPNTGLTEQVIDVISPEAVLTANNNYILLATTVNDTFSDPATGDVYTVTAVTTNMAGKVTGVTVKDSAAVVSMLAVVTDESAAIAAGKAARSPRFSGIDQRHLHLPDRRRRHQQL